MPVTAKTREARLQLEQEYLCAALHGTCAGTVSFSDLLAICPLEMLTEGTIPYGIYQAMKVVNEQGIKITLDALWIYIYEQQNKVKRDAFFQGDKLTPKILASFSFSIFGKTPDTIYLYAQRVRNEGIKREIEQKLQAAIGDCQYYGNDAYDIAKTLDSISGIITGSNELSESNNFSELAARVQESIRPDYAGQPLPTYYGNLNRVIAGGFSPGELIILAARPGMGKTALAGCIAIEMARNGVQTLFISREVKDLTIGQRLFAREGHFDVSRFRYKADYNDNWYNQSYSAYEKIKDLPLKVVERSIAPMTPLEIRRIAKTMPKVSFIVIDYLQLLNPDTKQNNREREVAEMSRSMKQLALDCDCPILLLSQLNRSITQTSREPMLSDLRESGAIEQDADIVMFLHANKNDEREIIMPVKLIVAKSRSSSQGIAYMTFEKQYCDFKEDKFGNFWNEKRQNENSDSCEL